MFNMNELDLSDLTMGSMVMLVISVVYSFYKASRVNRDIKSIRKWLYLIQFYCLKEEREIIDAMIGDEGGAVERISPAVSISDRKTVFSYEGGEYTSLLNNREDSVVIRIYDKEKKEVDSAVVTRTLPEFHIIKDVTKTLISNHINIGYNLKRLKLILSNIEIPNSKDVKEVTERISNYVVETSDSYIDADRYNIEQGVLTLDDSELIQQLLTEGKVTLAILGR